MDEAGAQTTLSPKLESPQDNWKPYARWNKMVASFPTAATRERTKQDVS